MHCNTEDDCNELVKLLPPTEAALLDWAINLMADVVQHEEYNKMNARNIAMVFAPNMTQVFFYHPFLLFLVSLVLNLNMVQMADPLTALIHAVQVMNFLKTLILKTLSEREESASKDRLLSSYSPTTHSATADGGISNEQVLGSSPSKEASAAKLLRAATLSRLECDPEEKLWSSWSGDGEEEFESISGNSTPNASEMATVEHERGGGGGHDSKEWQSLRKGVRQLCRHPVFQLSKSTKKSRNLGIVNTRGGG
ncbi:hypothetical protein Gorai_018485 [Gossypium raimondii]|uniref:Rho-GAP domain-containing protein n=1 Tax=Gossypium raimondii TaxID=29730 RepID=A0A7J8PKI4_GOSRA|nr:hypothetical protein [Gossypium raimondii]